MSNPVYEERDIDPAGYPKRSVEEVYRGEGLEAAAKKLPKPLWVIAIFTAITTVAVVLVLGYAAISYISFANAMSEVTAEETSQVEEDVPSDDPTE